MKLYYAPAACSLAVHIALRDVGVPFTLAKVDLSRHMLENGASYREVNPRGYVPLLEMPDGTRRSEASALLQLVADLDPAQRLIGAVGTARRLDVVQWLAFIATELHKAFSPWLWSPDTADSTVAAVRARLAARFADLDSHLASHEHLAGDFSVADAYAFTIVRWAGLLQLPLGRHPHLEAWLRRVERRPDVQAALRAEGLLS